jgi:bifunctional DNA-binding transcriptional regulator/antitoxin component of YhaV-PrlF toxin-antitoxin module
MTRKIVKTTERGQITLPKRWRAHFMTENFLLEMHDDKLVVTPFVLDADEEILFDAERDNDGKGVSPDAMIRMLKKLRHG